MPQLLSIISKKQRLDRAWGVVRGNKVASGIDGVTIEDFESSQKTHLQKIAQDLRSKQYSFQPSRRVGLPKDSGGVRNIHVFALRDKIVQQSIQSLLLAKTKGESLFPEVYNDIAIAYVPKLNGVKVAVDKIKRLHAEDYNYITCLDIKDFFDNIPGEELYQKIIKRLTDHSIDWLIRATIDQEVYKLADPINGVLQGAILAPLYSNIYLSEYDAALTQAGIQAIRYADDLAILSKSGQEAKANKDLARSILNDLAKMDFYPDDGSKKSPKVRCFNHFGEFLGIRFSKGPRGLVIGPTQEKVDAEKQRLTEVFMSKEKHTFVEKIVTSNRSLQSWSQHYFGVGCQESPMRAATGDITIHYTTLSHRELLRIGIIPRERVLTREQLNELGVMGPTFFKRRR